MNSNTRRGRWTAKNLSLAGAVVGGVVLAYRFSTRASFRGRNVLITGGSRGLGLELARIFGADGSRVFICARTLADVQRAVNDLHELNVDAHGFSCDAHSADAVQEMVDQIQQRWGAIDVLINNAGIIQVGPELCMRRDDYENAMNTHFWAPFNTIQAVLPGMRQRGVGRIVNIASFGGEVAVPHLLPYCASKFALVGYSQGLTAEVASDGISVTTVCPGLMRTGSPRNALFKGQHRKEYAWFSVGASLPFFTISSKRAAKKIVEACRRGQPQLELSLPAQVASRLHALLPNTFAHAQKIVNSLLPSANCHDRRNWRGDQSESAISPSPVTWLNEQAALKNNEVR